MDRFWEGAVTIGIAIVGVALLAVLFSQKSNAPAVIQSLASGFSNALGVAVSPVTGQGYNINTAYPNATGAGGFNMPFGFGY